MRGNDQKFLKGKQNGQEVQKNMYIVVEMNK